MCLINSAKDPYKRMRGGIYNLIPTLTLSQGSLQADLVTK